jgi:pyruvate dehydrogenase E2 component (dihydrolipoamide acetyltransferase)
LEEAPEEEAVPPAEHPAVRPGPRPQTPDAHQAPAPPTAEQREILALPSVRALAKELGVDLALVRGTGPGGRIVMQDVEDIAQEAAYSGHTPPTASAPALPPGADADAYGPIERFPFRGVRRTMAKRMAESASKQAQVTTMDQADVTVLRHIREKEKEVAAGRGIRLTYLAFAVKACTSALKRFPRLNATLDPTGDEYTLKHYCNVGIAVDTEHGLMVPNIKNAGDKSIYDIASELVDLVHKAQERTLDVADLHGGTFTITNYGAIGSTYATPIVNYPEVAILGMGRVGEVPVVRNGQIVARLVLPLSLTFDHQLVDGAEAARFLNAVVGYLEDPDLLLLEGA